MKLHRITKLELAGRYSLSLQFADGLERTVNLEPVLLGELFGPLKDPLLFAQATLDPEVRTVVWPNGADFNPATLHDWPEHKAAFVVEANRSVRKVVTA